MANYKVRIKNFRGKRIEGDLIKKEKGLIGKVRIYNRALFDVEIKALYEATK